MNNLPFVIWILGWGYLGKTHDIDEEFDWALVPNWIYRLSVWVCVGWLLYRGN
jgi:hypothetical protein